MLAQIPFLTTDMSVLVSNLLSDVCDMDDERGATDQIIRPGHRAAFYLDISSTSPGHDAPHKDQTVSRPERPTLFTFGLCMIRMHRKRIATDQLGWVEPMGRSRFDSQLTPLV
jgi:hypothetical protein